MDDPLAASLRRVAAAGHTVTVLSLSQDEFEADLGRIPVAYIADAIRAVEAREAVGETSPPGPLSDPTERGRWAGQP
jgi:hypothetical protein